MTADISWLKFCFHKVLQQLLYLTPNPEQIGSASYHFGTYVYYICTDSPLLTLFFETLEKQP